MSEDQVDNLDLEAIFLQAVRIEDRATWQSVLQKKMREPQTRLDLGLCLIHAAKAGNTDALKAVLSLGPSLQTVDETGSRAMHYAARYGPAENVEILIRAGAAVSCSQVIPRGSEDIDWTPLHIACLHDNIETAKALLRAGANTNSTRGEQRLTPLHIASRCGHVAIVKLLLDNRSNPNCVAHCMEPTPLDMAVKHANIDIVRALCEGGADPNFLHMHIYQGTTLQRAVRQENVELVQTLLEASRKITFTDAISHDILTDVILNQQVEVLRMVCRAGVRVDSSSGGGAISFCSGLSALLRTALKTGQKEMLEILLDAGASPPEPTKSGKFLLHSAMEYMAIEQKYGRPTEKWYEIVTMLIERDITVDKPDSSQNYPLHFAIHCGLFDVARLLCEKTPDLVHAANNRGQTPLHTACGKGNVAFVETLLSYGADIEAEATNGRTPLFNAVDENCVEIIEKLLSLGARVNVFDTSLGMTPLHSAAISDQAQIAEMLIAHGADVEASFPLVVETPLMMAAGVNAADSAECLLRHGANPNTFDANRHHSALNRAILHFKPGERGFGIVEVLLEFGAVLNWEDSDGYMPLEHCIYQAVSRKMDRLRSIKTMVEAGAPLGPRLHTRERRSPLFWLTFSGMYTEANYLVNTGWPLCEETWINLPGKTKDQDKLHAYFLLRRAATPFLRDLARNVVRQQLLLASGGTEIISRVKKLPVPGTVQKFLMFRDRDYCESQAYFEWLLQQANIVVPPHYL